MQRDGLPTPSSSWEIVPAEAFAQLGPVYRLGQAQRARPLKTRILEHLAERPRILSELVEATGNPRSSVATALTALRNRGAVTKIGGCPEWRLPA